MKRRSKLKCLLTTLPSLRPLRSLLRTMVGKRRSQHSTRHNINFDSSDEDGNADGLTSGRTENHRHMKYSFVDEKMSKQTSYVALPISPQKRARVVSPPTDSVTALADVSDATQSHEDLDLNYLYHRIESLEVDSSSRKRTAGVRFPLLLTC